MKAAFYTEPGPAREVLQLGELETPTTGPGEVRVRLRTSGVNPSDVKARSGRVRRALGFPLVVPHSDGAGDIDLVGEGVPASRVGERVWVSINLRFFIIYEAPLEQRQAAIAELTAMMDAGNLIHTIGARFPLIRIASAHEAVESGKVMGNVVVDID
jgi:NADPH:quinone reductase-like Zn-dependent oxidoreductase